MSELVPATQPPSAVGRILDQLQTRVAILVKESTMDRHGALQSLPPAIRQSELPAITRRSLSVILRSIRVNRSPSADDLRSAREIAAQRADEAVPLPLVIGNWQHGFERIWQEVSSIANPDEIIEIEYIGAALFSLLGIYIETVVESYQRERAVIDSEVSSANHLVARMLLDGQDAQSYADRFRIELASSYHVVALAIEPLPDELVEDPTGRTVAGRRKLRHILRIADFHRTPPVLTTLGPSGGHLLVAAAAEASSPPPYDVVRDLVVRIQSSAGAQVRAGFIDNVPLDEVSRSGQLATEVLTLAGSRHRPPQVCRLADVALEYQLSRPGEGSQLLDLLLVPLEPFPELLELLECYLRRDMDRMSTARALRVHPNTVNNRLRRITSLLGTDPNTFEGVMTLGAALARRRLNVHRSGSNTACS
ncbi:PucR family transcriptional regulator [Rhodococcus wratislaviensis]|uniref:PucR family transcriptional regulator n=1 Tax=Rhodococcus wratislaviensis TaxID=44752 RepID=UPI0035144EDD